jgi:hypothetical protein
MSTNAYDYGKNVFNSGGLNLGLDTNANSGWLAEKARQDQQAQQRRDADQAAQRAQQEAAQRKTS